MDITKTELENHILVMANSYGLEKNYQVLLGPKNFGSPSLPKVVELIIQEMFVNEFDRNHCHPEELDAYESILAYSQELRDKGWVDFK